MDMKDNIVRGMEDIANKYNCELCTGGNDVVSNREKTILRRNKEENTLTIYTNNLNEYDIHIITEYMKFYFLD